MTRLNIALIGPGLVGKEFLLQLSKFAHPKLQFSLIALVNSRKMKLSSALPFEADLINGIDVNLNDFINHVKAHCPCVVVDCTSSAEIANIYPELLQSVHVVTPNKKGYSSSMELFQNIKEASLKYNTFHFHESTVGAGLPILSTLYDLVNTGDEIVKIEGIFSGTLSYIFNNFSILGQDKPVKFSKVVAEAKKLGYTEPDPRDDLNGMDVARKVTILGRVAGLNLSIENLQLQNIVPEELRCIKTGDEFMEKITVFDDYFDKLNQDALKENSVLRYVGIVDPNGISKVILQKYPSSHPFSSLKGSDNVIAFTTKRFPNPLIIQGAGAGAAVTAFGMFSDVLKIGRAIVGPL